MLRSLLTQCLTIILVAVSEPGCTQFPFQGLPVYAHYNSDNTTLPTDMIYRVHEDRNGYIWLATDKGLIRYDGRSFSLMNTGAAEDFVATCMTRNNQLWLFAFSGHTVALDLNTHTVLNTDSMYQLYHVPIANTFVVLGFEAGAGNLKLFRQANRHVVTVNLYSGVKTAKRQFAEQKAKELLTIFHFSREQQRIYGRELVDIFKHNCYGLSVRDSFVTIGNKIFLTLPGKEAELYFNGAGFGILSAISGFSRREDDLYLSGLSIGLCCLKNYFTASSEKVKPEYLLPGEAITSMEQDYLGNLWASSHGNGLFCFPFSERNTRYYNRSSGLHGDQVTAVRHFPDGLTCIGYKGGALELFRGMPGQPDAIAVKARAGISDLKHFEKIGGKLVAFTRSEPFQLPLAQIRHVNIFSGPQYAESGTDAGYKHGIKCGERVYYISGTNLVCYDSSGVLKALPSMTKGHPKPLCVFPLSDTAFYVGTIAGCLYNGRVLPYLGNVQVNAVDTVRGLLVWATHAGVYTVPLHNAGRASDLRKIADGAFTELLYHRGHLYLQSGYEVIVLDVNDWRMVAKFSAKNYVLPFRLRTFSVLESEIIFGGSRGVFYTSLKDQIANWQHRGVKMHIVCSLNGYAPAKKISRCLYQKNATVVFRLDVLNYEDGDHEISCSVLRNGELLYRYGKPDAGGQLSLNPPGPGTYRIEYTVAVAGCAEVRQLAYTLIVLPLWYQQLWFAILSWAAGLALIILSVLWLSRKRIQHAGKRLQQELYLKDLEAQSLLGQLKPHFIFNALTPLQVFFLDGQKGKGLSYLNNFSQLLRGMLHAMRAKNSTLASEIALLSRYFDVQQERFDQGFVYNITVQCSMPADRYLVPTMLLQPLAENALEHGLTKASGDGSISIMVSETETALCISVSDNGKGLPVNFAVPQNHALAIITERVQLLRKIEGVGAFTMQNNITGQPGACARLVLPRKITDNDET